MRARFILKYRQKLASSSEHEAGQLIGNGGYRFWKKIIGECRRAGAKNRKRVVKTWCFSYGFDYLMFRKFAFFQTWRPINPFKTEVDNIFHAFKRTAHHSVRCFFR